MWGTPNIDDTLQTFERFIPTHVGNTQLVSGVTPFEPVHPHACGEHIAPMANEKIGAGSSPRMWGTPTVHV